MGTSRIRLGKSKLVVCLSVVGNNILTRRNG